MENVVLIGPTGCGKTTVAPLLGDALGMPWLELDNIRWRYYAEIGYSEDRAAQVQEDLGIEGLLDYWKPFELHSVERLLEEHPSHHVLALGGGQSVYTDDDDLRRAVGALSTSRVVLLLPSDEVESAVSTLIQRIGLAAPELPESLMPSIEQMARQQFLSPSNRSLADHVVYNGHLTVEGTVQAVLGVLR